MSKLRKTIQIIAAISLAMITLAPLGSMTALGQRPRFADPFQSGNGGFGSIITAPQTQLPQLPQIQSPQLQLPQLQSPQLQLPQLQSPQLQLPQLQSPQFQLPQLQSPQFQLPQTGLPNFSPQQALTQGNPLGGVLPTLDLPRAIPSDPSNFNLQPFPIFPNSGLGQRQLQVLPPPAQQLPQNLNVPQQGFGFQGFGTPQLRQPALGQFPNLGGFQGGFTPAPNRGFFQSTGANFLPAVDFSWPRAQWQRFQNDFLPRLFERPRFRHTYLHGSNRSGVDGNELDINDFELATTLIRPNWLGSGQPLRISPGAIFSFWDGPETESTGFDLPSKAFSIYVGLDHVTDLTRNSGLETNLTLGFYSDYENLSSDAFRGTGRLLGWQRINSYTVAKLGVEYFDRIRVKILPAVGLFFAPNPDMKFDLYFPRTKLSHRIPNFGDYEAWAYAGGEYGGGSWAIERIDGSDDQADINDVRAFIGMEWVGPRRVTGFVDFGYAFEREVVYRSNPIDDLNLQDTLFVRTGVAF